MTVAKALLVGGSGFIGTNLSIRILSKGKNIIILDRFEPKHLLKRGFAGGCTYVSGSYGDRALLENILPEVDVIYHLASTVDPRSSNASPSNDIETNLLPFIKMLDTVKSFPGIRIIMVSSGGAVYGTSTLPRIREDHPNNPKSSYGVIKLTQEKYLKLYGENHGIKYCILRLSNPYGPFQDPNGKQGVVSNFMIKIMKGEDLVVIGDGSVVRDFFYIEDTCNAILKADSHVLESGNVFNIGSGIGYSITSLISEIEMVTNRRAAVKFVASASADPVTNVLDVELAREILGWDANISLREGLVRLYRHLEAD